MFLLTILVSQALGHRLTESQRTVPHYYLSTDVEVDQLIELCDRVNDRLAKRAISKEEAENLKVTLNDVIIKAAAATCLRIPECNSSWQGDFIRQ
ncbi:Pyruvate dehydrogenase E2 component (Dihydrolipoamide acetyltransferase) [Fasciolopsis buskii]|uniref:Pyruvate dehydrogenase E2 component (Dihydrolipoamide acetyltransferase) n=1 Tax=Fasciolopsis buskii TaxID=27845 RepID=A0A8E0S1J9_9TREM|nr:Pyruvate dehydrogenase E2 component (Dihydrolipoamide acetyltransferase) [Fasciolopsis buski]